MFPKEGKRCSDGETRDRQRANRPRKVDLEGRSSDRHRFDVCDWWSGNRVLLAFPFLECAESSNDLRGRSRKKFDGKICGCEKPDASHTSFVKGK